MCFFVLWRESCNNIQVLECCLEISPGTVELRQFDWVIQQGPKFGWQEGYAAFSVSPPSKRAVMRYIANQEQRHAKTTSEDELMEMLKKSGIEYDSRFVVG